MSVPVITVRGEAQLQGPPDLATMSITVVSNGAEAAPVRAELASASATIRQLLEARAASLESWNTAGLNVSPVFKSRGTKITGYQGSVTTTAVVKDLQTIADLVTAVGDLPGSSIDGPWWSLRPDNPLFRDARRAAIDDARGRAADYADAFGGTVGALLEVSDLDGGFGGSPARFAVKVMSDAGGEAPIDLEPAAQQVSGQVTVRFEMDLPN